MSTELAETGPIDYLVVEFPGSKMTGEGLPLLVELEDTGIIRILDLVFVKRELDGSVKALAISDFDNDGELDLAVFEGAGSGLLDQDDIDEATSVIEPGSSAGILVYENVWAGPFAAALRRGGGAAGGQRPDPGPGDPRRTRQGRSRSRIRRGLRSYRPLLTHRKAQPMPGLIRGIARTAVVAGTATAVSGRVQRRQQGRWAQQEQEAAQQQAYAQPAPAYAEPAPAPAEAPGGGMEDKLAQLQQLGELRDAGVLSDAEFEAQKGKILYA